MEDIEIPINFAVIFLGIIGIIRAFTDYLLKQKLINSGLVDTKSFKILNSPAVDNRFPALKWGLVAFFAGIGLIVIEYMGYSHESPLPFGVEMVCISLGFLVYYFLVRKDMNRKRDVDEPV